MPSGPQKCQHASNGPTALHAHCYAKLVHAPSACLQLPEANPKLLKSKFAPRDAADAVKHPHDAAELRVLGVQVLGVGVVVREGHVG